MKHARAPQLVLALLAVAAIAVLGGGCSSSDPVAPAGATVNVRGTAGYSQDSVTINVGQSVTWIWDASGHSVTSSDMVAGLPGCTPNGLFDSGVLNAGASFSRTFTVAGTYPYFCKTGTDCGTSFESAVVVVQ